MPGMSLAPDPTTDDPQLAAICHELVARHQAHTILLYGSRADGSAGEDSDYDVAAYAPVAEPLRIARKEGSVYWDVWVYPQAELDVVTEEALRLRGSRILLQRGHEGQDLLDRVEALYRAGPVPLSANEIKTRTVWANKMLARIGRGDPEGNYRRVWLLQALLEDYFQRRTMWFEGPKKALRWLEQFDLRTYRAYCQALEPGANVQVIAALVQRLARPISG
jgi:predicted nucleotidyltransferase